MTNTSGLLTFSNFNGRLQQSQSSLLRKRQLDEKYWLTEMKTKSPDLGRLNIYSIRNKFDVKIYRCQ